MNNEPNDPDQPAAAPLATEAARRAEVLQRVAQMFRHAGADPMMQALRRAVEDFRLGQMP